MSVGAFRFSRTDAMLRPAPESVHPRSRTGSMISLRLAPLAACALLLGACTPPAAGPSPRPDESALLLARVHSDTAAGADSLSAWLLRACRGNVDVRRGCVERALYGVLERSGGARARAPPPPPAARAAGA